MSSLAERVAVLRDEVLQTAERGDLQHTGAEIFDATVRCLASYDATDPGIDLALHDALSQCLAWGDDEHVLLSEAKDVSERLLAAAHRALASAEEEMLVAEAASEVVCTAARVVARAALSRVNEERTELLREEATLTRLQAAVAGEDAVLATLPGGRAGRR